MAEREQKIVTVGGGNGSPVVNEALLRTGKVHYIDAISAVFDTGGATGRRRTDSRGQEIAFSDPMRNLISLVDPDLHGSAQYQALVDHLTSRFWGHVLGQEVFAHFHEDGDGFDKVQDHLTALTGIKFMGRVLPSTGVSTNIKFLTSSNRLFTGEDQLDANRMSKNMIINMWLEKDAVAYPDAKDALENADFITLACGSMYGSVLCNTLPDGIKEAFERTKAKIYLVTNLVSTRSETHSFTPIDFVNLVQRYAGRQLSGLIVPEMTQKQFESDHSEVAALYDLDHSHFLGWEGKDLKIIEQEGVEVITHKATNVVNTDTKGSIVRHDPIKLAEAFKTIL